VSPTVAIASEFLDAFARIPQAQQKKVRAFLQKFRANPTSAAINYEKLQGNKDQRIRSVRIDQKYRAIVLHPDTGHVYVLMWVANHDEAMDWAARRTFQVNPHTGALQVLCEDETQRSMPPHTTNRPGLLDHHGDEVLLSFGVPEILLPAVRAVRRPEDLTALGRHLPAEAAESLFWLAEGDSPEAVREAMASRPKEQVNTADLAAALQHPDSRRRFVTILTDAELTSILDAPLEKWRVFLHPSQERLVGKAFNGPARVTGGAGTGKTIVAMHRARHLARTLCQSREDRILFTTYTANLAQNVEQTLSHLCGPERARIEVIHLHAWAARFLRKRGISFEVASANELDACWEDAIARSRQREFEAGFLRQEWEQVVQLNDIQVAADYLKVPRTGRGRTLSRLQRQKVWYVFDHYVEALHNRGKRDWTSVIRETREHLDQTKPALPYKAIVVDEAQDFHAEEWRLIRALIPQGRNDIFLVGDAHQRIYGQRIALRACGIHVQGRSSRLQINYRTTEEIRAWAMAMLEGVEIDDLDGEREPEKGYKSLLTGPRPEIHHCTSRSEELVHLGERLKELVGLHPPEHICLVARTNKLLRDDYQPMTNGLGLECTLLDKTSEGGGVRLATMHRVKGLEFPVVILAGMNDKYMPLKVSAEPEDPVASAEHEERERSLLFVAATRARDLLVVTGWGTPSPFLPLGGEGRT
jgi:hypothetical protein